MVQTRQRTIIEVVVDIHDIINKKNALRELSDDTFKACVSDLAIQLSQISPYNEYTEEELYNDFINLKSWRSNYDKTFSARIRYGLTLIENFYDNFYSVCDKRNRSFISLWRNPSFLEKVLALNRKMHNTPYLSELKRTVYFASGLSKTTMFRPTLAKAIVEQYGVKTVLDPCAGWGGRLLGSIAANAHYVGFEPNTQTYKNTIQLIDFLNINDRVELYNEPAQNIDNVIDRNRMFDCTLTSPPYYDLEVYSNEETQSINNVSTYTDWLEQFLYPIIESCSSRLNSNGISCWNTARVGSYDIPSDIANKHSELGYKLTDTYNITNHTRPSSGDKRLNSDITHVFSRSIGKQKIEFFS